MPDRSSWKSLARLTRTTGERRFPSFEDLVGRLVEAGAARSRDELLRERRDLLPTVFFDWVRAGQTACLFASGLAANRDRAGMLTVVVDGILIAEAVRNELAQALEAASGGLAEAVILLLPEVQDVADLVALIDDLAQDPAWSWTEIVDDRYDPNLDDAWNIGLRWQLPGGEHASWVLGFGEFGSTPFTRRFPLTALVLRTRSQDWNGVPEVHDGDLIAVHLAHMPALLPEGTQVYEGNVWLSTRKNKQELLNGELLHGARAAVTFTLPNRARELFTTSPRAEV